MAQTQDSLTERGYNMTKLALSLLVVSPLLSNQLPPETSQLWSSGSGISYHWENWATDYQPQWEPISTAGILVTGLSYGFNPWLPPLEPSTPQTTIIPPASPSVPLQPCPPTNPPPSVPEPSTGLLTILPLIWLFKRFR